MKTLSKIKLNQLSSEDLEQRAMNALRGGSVCAGCACTCAGNAYPVANSGHSSGGNKATGTVPDYKSVSIEQP